MTTKKEQQKTRFWRTGNIIALLVFFGVPLLLYRSCTVGYDDYVYFVEVKNEELFSRVLQDEDVNIIAHGRRLKDKVTSLDIDKDNGNGAEQGNLRWYNCSGIDCDEGWQRSFIK